MKLTTRLMQISLADIKISITRRVIHRLHQAMTKRITAFTLYPDQEELNRDNTLNELEEYFQYKVELRPSELRVGTNFITDNRDFVPNGGTREKWYLFRIPIAEYEKKVW